MSKKSYKVYKTSKADSEPEGDNDNFETLLEMEVESSSGIKKQRIASDSKIFLLEDKKSKYYVNNSKLLFMVNWFLILVAVILAIAAITLNATLSSRITTLEQSNTIQTSKLYQSNDEIETIFAETKEFLWNTVVTVAATTAEKPRASEQPTTTWNLVEETTTNTNEVLEKTYPGKQLNKVKSLQDEMMKFSQNISSLRNTVDEMSRELNMLKANLAAAATKSHDTVHNTDHMSETTPSTQAKFSQAMKYYFEQATANWFDEVNAIKFQVQTLKTTFNQTSSKCSVSDIRSYSENLENVTKRVAKLEVTKSLRSDFETLAKNFRTEQSQTQTNIRGDIEDLKSKVARVSFKLANVSIETRSMHREILQVLPRIEFSLVVDELKEKIDQSSASVSRLDRNVQNLRRKSLATKQRMSAFLFKKNLSSNADQQNLSTTLLSFPSGFKPVAKSCQELLQLGYNISGIYTIQPKKDQPSLKTYCDMQSSRGGWTLVASIHENNIDGKCSVGDKWSSEQGTSTSTREVTGNWENFNVFGEIEAVTSRDYKNSAYFTLKSSDVMLWHVPNDVKIDQIEENAFFKYHTSNGFLSNFGNTLQSFYANHASLLSCSLQDLEVDILHEINITQKSITNLVANWYDYRYDGTNGINGTSIIDGGNDMFDNGNKVFYRASGGLFKQITYGQRYQCQHGACDVISAAIHPFTMLTWISNAGLSSFSIKVTSNTGADGRGQATTYSDRLTLPNNYRIKYKSYHIHGTKDASIAKVFFYISNLQRWNSLEPTFNVPSSISGTDNIDITVTFTNSRQVLLGYILLSRYDATSTRCRSSNAYSCRQNNVIRKTEVESVLKQIVQSADVAFHRKQFQKGVFAYPITFVKGNASSVTLSQREEVTPGFIQFRAYDSYGYPLALCTGIRMKSDSDPASYCIGGINTNLPNTVNDRCGDFADRQRKAMTSSAAASSVTRSLFDIDSSILIFTRNSNETLDST